MAATIEPGEGVVVVGPAPAESGPPAPRLLARREWLMIGAAALCFGAAFMALLFGIG
jgi:hypothetical protein